MHGVRIEERKGIDQANSTRNYDETNKRSIMRCSVTVSAHDTLTVGDWVRIPTPQQHDYKRDNQQTKFRRSKFFRLFREFLQRVWLLWHTRLPLCELCSSGHTVERARLLKFLGLTRLIFFQTFPKFFESCCYYYCIEIWITVKNTQYYGTHIFT